MKASDNRFYVKFMQLETSVQDNRNFTEFGAPLHEVYT